MDYGHEQEREDDVVRCAYCNGEALSMGFLGNLQWFRCRQCGMESPAGADRFEQNIEHPRGSWPSWVPGEQRRTV